MLLMHANNREDIKEAYAGDIVALAGLKEVRTGDTLCDPQKPVILEKMEFPEPVIEIAIEPKSKADQEKLGVALAKLVAEDPSFRVHTDQESGQTILKGMGELHLDIKVDILQAHLQGRGQYRRAAGRLSREDHAAGDRRSTRTRSRPAAPANMRRSRSSPSRCRRAAGFEFDNKIVGGNVPKEYIPGVEKGLESVLGSGVLAGFPVVDLKVTLIDGDYHDVDSSALAFEICSRAALARGAAEGRPGAARADHEGRGGDARGLYRLRHRRPQFAARPDPGPGHARQRQCRERDGAARQHVRLRQQSALHVAGARHLHHAIRPLRAGALARSPRKSRRSSPDPPLADRRETERRVLDGQRKVQSQQAALQCRHHWSRRPRQDVADGCDHQGSGRDRRRKYTAYDQIDKAPEEKARGITICDRARRVRDRQAATTRTSTALAMPTT